MIKHAMYHLPEDFQPTQPYKTRCVLYAFQHAFRIYKSDVLTLVAEAVQKEVNEQLQSLDLGERGYAMERKTALDQWQKLRYPLGYSDNAYSLLVKAIRSRTQELGEGLPLSENGQKSLAWFSDQLVATVKKSGARIQPPFWKTGRSFMVFRFAIKEAEKLLGISVENQGSRDTMIQLLCKAASFVKICNIPWSPNHTRAAGRPITTVQHTAWINLGQANAITRHADQDPSSVALTQATQAAVAQDSQADWSSLNLSIQNLHMILNRQGLPTEWTLDKMTYGTGIVTDVYMGPERVLM